MCHYAIKPHKCVGCGGVLGWNNDFVKCTQAKKTGVVCDTAAVKPANKLVRPVNCPRCNPGGGGTTA